MDFKVSVEQLASIISGHLVKNNLSGDICVKFVATDSRSLPPSPFVFFALKGPNFDGHRFISEAAEGGALVVVAERPVELPDGTAVIVVDDGLIALQRLARWWREQFTGRVVGIAGSNGKTVVKEMATAVLKSRYRVYRSPGSFNSQVGVALSLLRAPGDAEIYLIECGISRPGEMVKLREMVQPDLGILTNIGTAHLAGFGDTGVTAREKSLLFEAMEGELVTHCLTGEKLEEVAFNHPEILFVGGRQGDSLDYGLSFHGDTGEGQQVQAELPGDRSEQFTLYSHARHDIDNGSCAVGLGHILGLDAQEIASGLSAYHAAPLRIEVHTSTTGSGITLINDSYSADPLSMRSALNTLVRLSSGRTTIAVLGEMADLGELSRQAHDDVGKLVFSLGIDQLITVGEGAKGIAESAIAAGMPVESVFTTWDVSGCAQALEKTLHRGEVVLVKASRPVQLERTAAFLLESMSPTRAYIDLGIVAENVRRIRRWLPRESAIFAVVKSFGYGSDAIRVSELLERQGVDYLCVAYPDEAVLLRRQGIQIPILVTSVLPQEADKIARFNLSAVVFTRDLVEALGREATLRDMEIPVHLKVDTGMGRFGVDIEELRAFSCHAHAVDGVRVEGLMSHLSVADDPGEDAYTLSQIDRFRQAIKEVETGGVPLKYHHLANSAGVLRFPSAHFNAVRLGIGLYGCLDAASGEGESPALNAAISLHSRLVGIRQLGPGESVGYGRLYCTERPMTVGLVGLGYHDGLPRLVSNRGEVWIRGQRAPIIGNICMDVTMIDLTGVASARVGDDVVIYGSGEMGEPTVLEVAQWAETIPYEILCRISPRVRRIIRLA